MKRFTSMVFVIVVCVALTILQEARGQSGPRTTVPLSFFEEQLAADNVKWVDIGRDQLDGELRSVRTTDGASVSAFRTSLPEGTTSGWHFSAWLLERRRNAVVGVNNQSNLLVNILVPLIPWLLIFGFLWFFVFRQLRKGQKNNPKEPLRVFVVNQPGEPPRPPGVAGQEA